MKKAYVKPVFMAEEFVLSDSVAAGCALNPDTNGPLSFTLSDRLCAATNNCNHVPANSQNKSYFYKDYNDTQTYWQYATSDTDNTAYLFTTASTICDFIWPGESDENVMRVWDSSVVADRKNYYAVTDDKGNQLSFSQFVSGTGSSESAQHRPGYNGSAFFS